jgi:hypothetical protein
VASACVAGACVPASAAPEVEALDKFGAYRARRLVVRPVDEVRLASGSDEGQLPRVATLGRARDAGAMLLLRFAVDLPPGVAVMGAYLLLDRVPVVDPDPAGVSLHAARIVEPWVGRSTTWGRAPRLGDARLPATVATAASRTVRLDVRALVQRWRKHESDDQGIAVLADGSSATGMTFALADGVGESASPVFSVRAPGPPSLYAVATGGDSLPEPAIQGPRLELYVRP